MEEVVCLEDLERHVLQRMLVENLAEGKGIEPCLIESLQGALQVSSVQIYQVHDLEKLSLQLTHVVLCFRGQGTPDALPSPYRRTGGVFSLAKQADSAVLHFTQLLLLHVLVQLPELLFLLLFIGVALVLHQSFSFNFVYRHVLAVDEIHPSFHFETLLAQFESFKTCIIELIC